MKYVAVLKSKPNAREFTSLDEESLRMMYADAREEDTLLADSGLAAYTL